MNRKHYLQTQQNPATRAYCRDHSLVAFRMDNLGWGFDDERTDKHGNDFNYDGGDQKDFAMRLKRDPSGKRLVDLGCGNARVIRELSHLYPNSEFFGIDYFARDYNGRNLHIKQGDLEERLPFCDNFSDMTVSTSVFLYLFDKLAILKEAVRITKPGGLVSIEFPFRMLNIKKDELLGIITDQTDSLELRGEEGLNLLKKGALALPFKYIGCEEIIEKHKSLPFYIRSLYERKG